MLDPDPLPCFLLCSHQFFHVIQVILTSSAKKYDEIKDNIFPMDKKYKICFETDAIQKEYIK